MLFNMQSSLLEIQESPEYISRNYRSASAHRSCVHKKNDTCLRRYVKKSVASCVITDTVIIYDS